MKKQFLIYTLLILLGSCKFNKEGKEDDIKDINTLKEEVIDENIKAIKQGLDNFWEVEAPNGAKLLVNMDKIFYIKENPTDIDTSTRYFLHVTLMTGEKINLDFNYKDQELKSKNNSEYKDFAIAFRELPKEPIFSILTGQFNESGRIWQKVLHEQNFY
ncbi:hypothetical protein [Pontimicrobium aquaticum]|uniref:Uncharacterized protein n=1 Tax=Pontimicrobium aquaticum TaxID=2565367 RepID=A0A4U0EU58_9FLAO|nr:hypothetical protein [Pontimicrobium aquaticum]TJY34764.1 hypothetical protein E5167_10680 [Pontimicrobium aquaticum]